jgi:hypothetical protein
MIMIDTVIVVRVGKVPHHHPRRYHLRIPTSIIVPLVVADPDHHHLHPIDVGIPMRKMIVW